MLNVSSKKLKPEQPVDLAVPKEEKKSKLPWGPKSAIALSIVTFVLAQFLVFYIISFWFLLVLGRSWEVSSTDWVHTITGQFSFVVLSEAVILLVLGLFLRKRGGTLKQLGYSRRPVWDDIAWALIAFVVYFVLLMIVAALVGQLTSVDLEQRQDLGFDNIATSPEKMMAFISLVVLPPIVEETIFRGFLFGGLRSKLTFAGATTLTSVIFAAPHLLGSNDGLLWVAAIDTFILSLVLCYLREKTGALWAPIMVHAIKNMIAFTLFLSYIGAN
jgi:membrane protease YdiL (CAAX protease family)